MVFTGDGAASELVAGCGSKIDGALVGAKMDLVESGSSSRGLLNAKNEWRATDSMVVVNGMLGGGTGVLATKVIGEVDDDDEGVVLASTGLVCCSLAPEVGASLAV
jgi:hypothetical protein